MIDRKPIASDCAKIKRFAIHKALLAAEREHTRKSSLAAESLPQLQLVPPATEIAWDGLLSRYADIVIAGNHRGRRHSASGYHLQWLQRFDRYADAARVREASTSR